MDLILVIVKMYIEASSTSYYFPVLQRLCYPFLNPLQALLNLHDLANVNSFWVVIILTFSAYLR